MKLDVCPELTLWKKVWLYKTSHTASRLTEAFIKTPWGSWQKSCWSYALPFKQTVLECKKKYELLFRAEFPSFDLYVVAQTEIRGRGFFFNISLYQADPWRSKTENNLVHRLTFSSHLVSVFDVTLWRHGLQCIWLRLSVRTKCGGHQIYFLHRCTF